MSFSPAPGTVSDLKPLDSECTGWRVMDRPCSAFDKLLRCVNEHRAQGGYAGTVQALAMFVSVRSR